MRNKTFPKGTEIPMAFVSWDKQDITDPIIVCVLGSGKFVLIDGHKAKTPDGKPARVSKKVAKGIYELKEKINGRKVLTKQDLIGIFPINDSRNIIGVNPSGMKKEEITDLFLKLKEVGFYGLLFKRVVKDPNNQDRDTVQFIIVSTEEPGLTSL